MASVPLDAESLGLPGASALCKDLPETVITGHRDVQEMIVTAWWMSQDGPGIS